MLWTRFALAGRRNKLEPCRESAGDSLGEEGEDSLDWSSSFWTIFFDELGAWGRVRCGSARTASELYANEARDWERIAAENRDCWRL